MNIIDRMLGNEFNIVDTMVESSNSIDIVKDHYSRAKREELNNMKKRNITLIVGSVLALGVAGTTLGYQVGANSTSKQEVKQEEKQEIIKPHKVQEHKDIKQQEIIKPHKVQEHKDIKQQDIIKPHKVQEQQREEVKENHKYQKEYEEYLKYVKSTGGRAFPSYDEFLVVYNSYTNESTEKQESNEVNFKEDYNLIEEKIYKDIAISFNTCGVEGINEYMNNNDIIFIVNSTPNGDININDIQGGKYLNKEYIIVSLGDDLKDITNKDHRIKITISKSKGLNIDILD